LAASEGVGIDDMERLQIWVLEHVRPDLVPSHDIRSSCAQLGLHLRRDGGASVVQHCNGGTRRGADRREPAGVVGRVARDGHALGHGIRLHTHAAKETLEVLGDGQWEGRRLGAQELEACPEGVASSNVPGGLTQDHLVHRGHSAVPRRLVAAQPIECKRGVEPWRSDRARPSGKRADQIVEEPVHMKKRHHVEAQVRRSQKKRVDEYVRCHILVSERHDLRFVRGARGVHHKR
jgi:hypothetical protein